MSATVPSEVLDPVRVAAVRSTGLATSAPAPSFHRLVQLAAELLNAPVGFFTVVDAETSWYVASTGVPADVTSGPVEGSFCKYVIASKEELLVADAAADERTTGNPAIAEMGVRAWAGFPVRSPDGQILGSFCVVDTVEHQWTERDRTVLGSLASAVEDEVAHVLARRAMDDLRLRQRELLDLLQVAVLPASFPPTPGLEVAVRYEPANTVSGMGGDWYDVIDLGGSRVGFVVADVAGHDSPAVAAMAQLRPAFHAFARHGPTPSSVHGEMHDLMLELGVDRFLTSIYSIWDPTDRTMTYQAAGHPPPLLFRAGQEPLVCTGGLTSVLGIAGLAPNPTEHIIELQPGDTFVAFTDGLVERPGRDFDDGIAALAELGPKPDSQTAAQFADHLTGLSRPEGGWLDDMALLVATARSC